MGRLKIQYQYRCAGESGRACCIYDFHICLNRIIEYLYNPNIVFIDTDRDYVEFEVTSSRELLEQDIRFVTNFGDSRWRVVDKRPKILGPLPAECDDLKKRRKERGW